MQLTYLHRCLGLHNADSKKSCQPNKQSLLKHVTDKFVVSVLINKNIYSQSSCTISRQSCGEGVEIEDYREHMMKHNKMQFSSGFYGPVGNPINKGISHFKLSHSQIPNRNPSQNIVSK